MKIFSGPMWPVSNIVMNGYLPVSAGHSVYYEVRGNNAGKPVLFLHGGPGRGIDHSIWSFFNPRIYRIILVDQRGCGKSKPRGCLENNNTEALLKDLESLRILLGVKQWMIFGCGWGSALGLKYAQTFPDTVSEIILNNFIACTQSEVDWLFRYGASEFLPDAWEQFARPVAHMPGTILQAYYRLLTRGTEEEQRAAVERWTTWENAISDGANFSAKGADYDQALVVAKIACHYFLHGGFFSPGMQLLENMAVIRERKIKGVIVHGERDMVNPFKHARDLARAWPEAKFVLVPDAGHSVRDTRIQKALLAETKEFGGCGCLFKRTTADH
jgi:proline iminopeptidase